MASRRSGRYARRPQIRPQRKGALLASATVVVGGGTPFLPPVTEDIPLDLIETRTFGSRVIYERYGRARESD
jgi:hypothetical protein